MKTLLQSAVSRYIDMPGWYRLKAKLQQLPFAAATDGDEVLTNYLRHYYADFSDMELVLLLEDNCNSLMNADGSAKSDNECSFLVRHKIIALWHMLNERLTTTPPGLARLVADFNTGNPSKQ